jgi:hypothetical protein
LPRARRSNRFRQLQGRARRSLHWLSRNLEAFSPRPGGLPEDWRLKAFGELALVYAYLQEWRPPALREHLPVWRTFIIEHLEDPAFAQLARKRPAIAFAYLIPYLMLRATGYRSDYHEETLRLLRRGNLLRAAEVVPYRALEREHALWKSGWTRDEPRWRHLARATVLLQCNNPAAWDDEAAYSVTHTLFYLTDFGNRDAHLSQSERDRAVDTVECLLLHYWRIGHWDLVGELLVNLNCLRNGGSPIYEAAARAYHAAWRDDGTVPATQKAIRAAPVRKEADPFRLRYHPTLVAVLYCATAINTGFGRNSSA